MATTPSFQSSAVPPLGKAAVWLVCIMASIGFAFDIYELLMLPLIIKSAVFSLGGFVPGSDEYRNWARTLFFVPALVGGVSDCSVDI
jgi:hypothetical protein